MSPIYSDMVHDARCIASILVNDWCKNTPTRTLSHTYVGWVNHLYTVSDVLHDSCFAEGGHTPQYISDDYPPCSGNFSGLSTTRRDTGKTGKIRGEKERSNRQCTSLFIVLLLWLMMKNTFSLKYKFSLKIYIFLVLVSARLCSLSKQSSEQIVTSFSCRRKFPMWFRERNLYLHVLHVSILS